MTLSPSHLSGVQTPMVTPLTVFIPPVRRYLPTEFVKKFRESGSLRLSTFGTFKQHTNDEQRDVTEGDGFHSLRDTETNWTFGTYSAATAHAYVLSCTTRTNLPAEFGEDFFEIMDPVAFCAEIARMIPHCIGAIIGPCIYVDEKVIRHEGNPPPMEDLVVGDGTTNVSLEKVMAESAKLQGPRQFFLKDRRFEHQSEVRMVWQVSLPATEPIIVQHPVLLGLISPANPATA